MENFKQKALKNCSVTPWSWWRLHKFVKVTSCVLLSMRLLKNMVTLPIYIYQWLFRPFFGQRCRFYPSCSDYCIQTIQHHGIVKGIVLSSYRLLRCHPGCKGGYDPVITSESNENTGTPESAKFIAWSPSTAKKIN